jgi:hypothetical protein
MAKEEKMTEIQELNRNIEVMIGLLLRLLTKNHEGLSLKDQISVLDELGVRPVSIAKIVGRTPKHVGKELVGIRKARRS